MGVVQALSRVSVLSVAMIAATSGVAAQVAEQDTKLWSDSVWTAALNGDRNETLKALESIPEGVDPDNVTDIRNAIDLLKSNFDKQQVERDKQIAEQREELTKKLEA